MWLSDTLANLVSALGTAKDKSLSNQFGLRVLTKPELDAAYSGDWIAGKIIDIPVEDATREWRVWQTDTGEVEELEEEERRLKVRQTVAKALKMARLYGGSVILLGTGDANPAEEFRIDRLGRGGLQYLTALSMHEIQVEGLVRDPLSPFYGQPEWYSLNSAEKTILRIHPSRVVPFCGLPKLENSLNTDGWGYSVLQRVFDAVMNAAATSATLASLIQEAKVDVFKVKGLTSNVTTAGYVDRILKRFSLANTAKSVNNALLIDAEEEWEQKTISFAQYPEVLNAFLQVAAGAADIPATRLLGQSPKGLQSTGDGELKNYYDAVSIRQETDLRPALERLDEALIRSALASRPADIWFDFKPLWQLNESEKATIAKTKAEAINVYVSTGLFPQEALAKSAGNLIVEDGFLPGFEEALAEAPPIDFSEPDDDETIPGGQGGDTTEGGAD